MDLGTGVLIGLSAAGVVLALASIVPVIVGALRLRTHMQAMKKSNVFLSFLALQIQMNRLGHIAQRASALSQRANALNASLQDSLKNSGAQQAQASMQQAGASISALLEDLS
jgi:hypothetical protein